MPTLPTPDPRWCNVTIHKAQIGSEFCLVPNSIAQSPHLSLEARGLLLYLLSLPDAWEIRMDSLCKHARLSIRPLRRIVRELAAAGHMHRFSIPGKTPDTFSGSRWHVYADPTHLSARLAKTALPKGFHRRPGLFAKVGKRPDVHKETADETNNHRKASRPLPHHDELAAFLAANSLSDRIAAVYFSHDAAYQAFPANADGSPPPKRDWRTGLLTFAATQSITAAR